MHITVFFDYLCPFAWRASRWLDVLATQRPELVIDWRYFSLEQVNVPADSDWRLWEQSPDYAGFNGWNKYRGLNAFWATEAVRRQDAGAFSQFRRAVYDARHEANLDIHDRQVLAEMAQRTGIDMERYARDVADRSLLTVLQHDHEYAKATYQCFGVPTVCFDNGYAVYIKLSALVSDADAGPLFDDVCHNATHRPWLAELKRPNP